VGYDAQDAFFDVWVCMGMRVLLILPLTSSCQFCVL
jgi:hypothetical protein